jgi:hypothetical protein
MPPVVVLVVAYLVLFTALPDRARFAVGWRALDQAADRVERGEGVSGRIGLYRVESSEGSPGTATLNLAGGLTFGSWSLVRSAAPPGTMTCHHLASRWYLCSWGDLD